jgi:Fe-S cluster assembly protein SufD
VASGRARGVYDGKIVVAPGAAKSESSQSSRNLLLSPQAEIDSRPQLEILTDDVKCAHGATTGQLDEDMLFYLLSRGIDRATARGLLTFAFAEDVIAKLAIPTLRRSLEERVVRGLPDAELIREFV